MFSCDNCNNTKATYARGNRKENANKSITKVSILFAGLMGI